MTIPRTICLGFLTVIAIGTILLMMPFSTSTGDWNDPIKALFTATSAVCVTGLIVVDTGSYFSFWGQLFILCLIQIGGLGYMMITTFLALLIKRKFDFRQKFAIQQSFDRPFLQGSQNLVRSVLATTLIFELIGIFLLLTVFSQDHNFASSLWLAIFHSISAWNNAGFSLFSDSLVGYRSSVVLNLAISLLIIFGGIGYQVIIEMYLWFLSKIKGNQKKYCFSLNFKVVTTTTCVLLGLGAVAFLATEFHNTETLNSLPLSGKLIGAWFQSVTTRTAGFNSIDIGAMTGAGLFLTVGLMFIGASPSGTGGGIKTTTLGIIIGCTNSMLRGNDQVRMFKRTVPTPLILKAVAVVFGSGITIAIATILLSLTDANLQLLRIAFEVVSAFATVGLSTGITDSISSFGQIVLVFTMYIGRVGVLLFMSAILGDPEPSRIEYPKENLLVG
ncbi:MAG: TrkH family potassium uptake protein [Spirulinaceae cyanobacterium]